MPFVQVTYRCDILWFWVFIAIQTNGAAQGDGHIYRIIYSNENGLRKGGHISLISLVGAARFELTPPCAQGGCANGLR
jgi:hypothetical protein